MVNIWQPYQFQSSDKEMGNQLAQAKTNGVGCPDPALSLVSTSQFPGSGCPLYVEIWSTPYVHYMLTFGVLQMSTYNVHIECFRCQHTMDIWSQGNPFQWDSRIDSWSTPLCMSTRWLELTSDSAGSGHPTPFVLACASWLPISLSEDWNFGPPEAGGQTAGLKWSCFSTWRFRSHL